MEHSQVQQFQSLVRSVEAGRPCALCVVLSTRGSTPQTPGATLLLHADGRTEGTIGGGCVEVQVCRRALAMLADGQSGTVTFDLDADSDSDDELICGGTMEIAVVPVREPAGLAPFREAVRQMALQHVAEIPIRLRQASKQVEYRLHIEATPTLLIAGAGHVGAELARRAVGLDYRVVVFDDRASLLSADRLPPPIETAGGDIAATLGDWSIDTNTYVVVVTRGHRHDEQALHAVLDSPAKYIGMIGSRKKIRRTFDNLAERGADRGKLQQVHAPIGLSIGAITVPEIAVSIAAELTQVRRAHRVKAVEGPFKIAPA
jgi:xanthine dehydrogenase accessory factor